MNSEEIANIQRAAHSRLGIELNTQQAIGTLDWWHVATQGLRFSSGWVGTVGVRAYHMLWERSGNTQRGIPGAERASWLGADTMVSDMALHRDWIDPDRQILTGQWITELDINGQYLSAAGIELGHGTPEEILNPRDLAAYTPHPGYVRISSAPSPVELSAKLPGLWRGFRGLEVGQVLAMPTVRFLTGRGVELDASQVLIWPKHRRHLEAWQRLFREARKYLAAGAANGSLAARTALGLVKQVTNTTLGGWMRAERNTSDLMNRYWSDMIISEANVRALVHLERAALTGFPTLGQFRDAAWFVGPRDFEPGGLQIDKTLYPTGRDGMLGKWKRARSVPVSGALLAAQQTGSPATFVRIMKDAMQHTYTSTTA